VLQEDEMNKLMEEQIAGLTIRFDEYLAEQRAKEKVSIHAVHLLLGVSRTQLAKFLCCHFIFAIIDILMFLRTFLFFSWLF